MKVALTGATGFVGSHILTELHKHGHEVTALVRDDAQAGSVAACGATPAVADLYDRPTVASVLANVDGAIRRVLEDESARGRYVIGNGLHPTVAELTQAAAVAVGAPGAVPGSDDEARARLGDYFAEVLLHDEGTDAAKARAELGWYPSHPSLTDEFRHGSYRT